MKTTDFEALVWQVVASIPEGKVTTYGRVAELCGYSNQARLVGKVLSRLPADTSIPWHRVVNAQGAISFAIGSDAYRRQQSRLLKENVLLPKGKVVLKQYLWP